MLFIVGPVPAQNGDAYRVVKRIALSYESTKRPDYAILPYKELERPRIGLALSGGGIRGIAQIGVLKVLQEEGVPIDVIVGTSIGGAVGALLASGYSPDDILQQIRRTEWNTILSDSPKRSSLFLGEKEKRGRAILQFRMDKLRPVLPEALSPGQRLSNIFTELILNAPYHENDFSKLKIPLRIVATDMLSGRKIILDKGDLAQAIRATIAIPLLFTPVTVDSLVLVDGGVLDNIPVDEARKAGADIVIAIDTTSPLRTPENLEAPWEIADQITTIMQQEKDRRQLQNADAVISFEDLKIISTDFDAIDYLYNEGRKRARRNIDVIKKAIHRRYVSALNDTVFHIQKVEIDGANLIYLSRFLNPNRETYSLGEIYKAIERIYLSGDVNSIEAKVMSNGVKSILHFQLHFNPILRSVHIYGNTQISSDSILAFITPLLKKPINPFRTQKAVEHIATLYRQHGFSLAKVDRIIYNEREHSAHFYIVEGLVHRVDVTGLKKTKKFVIDREFNIHPGELFQFHKAKSGLDNIFATDLFSAVNLSVESRSVSHNLKLSFIEKPSHVVRLGARYDNERTVRAFMELADDNFLGTANDLTFHLQYGGRDYKSFIDLRADRLFKSYLTGGFNLHYFNSKHYAYADLEPTGEYARRAAGINITLGQQIGRYGTLSGNLRFEKIEIDPISGYGYDVGSLNINTIGMKTVIDTRDRAPFPSEGKYHIFFYEISSGLFLGADISYFKVMNQLSTFTTWRKRHTFCPKILWGVSDMTTPYSEQFRIGGINSFYGLREGQLWGRYMILLSFEYRYWLPKVWALESYISARYDLGATWNKMEEINSQDFISGVGAALSFSTPIGPISFAYGRSNRGQRRLYFSAGFEF